MNKKCEELPRVRWTRVFQPAHNFCDFILVFSSRLAITVPETTKIPIAQDLVYCQKMKWILVISCYNLLFSALLHRRE